MRTLLVAVALALAACTTPTPDQIRSANYGPAPTDYQAQVKAHMGKILFDPYTAVYRFGQPPRKGYVYLNGTIHAPEFGWIAEVGINAKNRFGGYVGEEPHVFLFRNGQVWEANPPRLSPQQ